MVKKSAAQDIMQPLYVAQPRRDRVRSCPRGELGATLVEYAIVAAMVAASFGAVAAFMQRAAARRADASIEAVADMVPCRVGLAGQGVDGCK